MQLGIYGLGRMGANMARRLLLGGHQVVVGNRSHGAVEELAAEGAIPSTSIEDFISKLESPRTAILMVPAGEATETLLHAVADLMSPGDIIIDGGNSNYKDTIRRGEMLKPRGLHYVDMGTSGGIWGLAEGYALMVGGDAEPVAHITPALKTLAPGPELGWGHVGPSGAGHFTKMVHNGIEYGMMQAYAEGFEILKAKESLNLDVSQIAHIWQHGSVVRSWLLDLTAEALDEDKNLNEIGDWVADSGEGRWTVNEAIDLDVPAPVITLSLYMRFVSRQQTSFAGKLLAAMRAKFGGHAVMKAE